MRPASGSRAGARRVLDHGAVIRARRHHRRDDGDHDQAGRAVAGIDIPVDVAAVVRWPQCLGDVRKPKAKGHAMWAEIQALLDSGALQAMEAS